MSHMVKPASIQKTPSIQMGMVNNQMNKQIVGTQYRMLNMYAAKKYKDFDDMPYYIFHEINAAL